MKTAGLAALLVAIAACSHQVQAPTQTQAQVENESLGCPLSQPIEVDATVVDVTGGVAVSFTGPPLAVDRIRANVHAMKEANGSQGDAFAVCPCASSAALEYGLASPAYGETVDGRYGGAYPSGNPSDDARTLMQPMRPASSSASVEDLPTGAVLVLKPKDEAKLQLLRDQVRANVGAMETACVGPH